MEGERLAASVSYRDVTKTTAVRMVNRTVEITEGDILIGDTSVRDRDDKGIFPSGNDGGNGATLPAGRAAAPIARAGQGSGYTAAPAKAKSLR